MSEVGTQSIRHATLTGRRCGRAGCKLGGVGTGRARHRGRSVVTPGMTAPPLARLDTSPVLCGQRSTR